MNSTWKYSFGFVAFATLSGLACAQEVNDASSGSDYDYTKHLSISVGADGLLSNAEVHSVGSNNYSFTSEGKFGYGLMGEIELGLADYVGIGIGAHILDRRFQISGGPVTWTRSIYTLMVPVEARFYLAKILSLSAGGFGSFPVGKVQDSFSNGSSSVTETGAGRRGADFGVTAALGVNVPIGDTFGLFGEVRYDYGLTDSSANSDLEEKIRDLMFTAGLKFRI